MPGCFHKLVMIPRQVLSESEYSILTKIADSVSGSLVITGIVVFTLSNVLNSSLSFLWGLLNTL